MAGTLNSLKKTIKSVSNTKKLTKTMQLIASSKLQKTARILDHINRYSKVLDEIQSTLDTTTLALEYQETEVLPEIFIIIVADRGLASNYNTKVIQVAKTYLAESNPIEVWTIGKKASTLPSQTVITKAFSSKDVEPGSIEYDSILKYLGAQITEHPNRAISVCYTHYTNSFVQEVRIVSLVHQPTSAVTDDIETAQALQPKTEPSNSRVLEQLKEQYCVAQFTHSLYHASASEHTARMQAMKSATDAATDIIDTLTLTYNKSRQAQITQEIAQIVSGMNSIKQ